MALETWTDQVNKNGILCIELATGVENVSRELDPLEISPEELTQLLNDDFKFFLKEKHQNKRTSRVDSWLCVYSR